MENLAIFQRFGITDGQSQFATRSQIEQLYNVPKTTLADNINALKEDNLISGSKIRHTAKDGKQYKTEVFSLNEVIAIGFRLRSDTAIRLQRYASNLLVQKMNAMAEEKRTLELELSYAWNKSDQKDLYQ
tara:strand:+ start:53 stop:442 length:390 start_codon:yes stop_codon:yes gene_type:complete